MKRLLSCAIAIVCLVGTIGATIINVPDDQPTIQAGIDAAVDGDTVLVQPGTYELCLNYNGKNIVVASLFLTTQDTSYISRTVIDGKDYCTGVTFENGEDSTAVLNGFTITNGRGSYGGGIRCWPASPTLANLVVKGNVAEGSEFPAGGGIFCWDSGPILSNVMVTENTATWAGGGIFCVDSNPSLVDVTVSGNTASGGGGIHWYGTDPSLSNLMVSGNTAVTGGGIRFYYSNPTLTNITVSKNTASWGGGISFSESNPTLVNVTFADNTAETGGAIDYSGESELTIVNSVLWNDLPEEIYVASSSTVSAVYSNIQGGWPGEGNIDFDPFFVDSSNGNYHLLDASPCIGAGTDSIQISGTWYYAPPTDSDGNLRPSPLGSSPDMGAYESVLGVPIMALSGTLSGGVLVLQWTPCVSTAAYWIHGMDNQAYFDPDLGNMLGVVPPGVLTFSSSNGIGDPNYNWTYLIVAVDDIDQEITRSNLFGEHDFEEDIP
jgi:hypothetical protein